MNIKLAKPGQMTRRCCVPRPQVAEQGPHCRRRLSAGQGLALQASLSRDSPRQLNPLRQRRNRV